MICFRSLFRFHSQILFRSLFRARFSIFDMYLDGFIWFCSAPCLGLWPLLMFTNAFVVMQHAHDLVLLKQFLEATIIQRSGGKFVMIISCRVHR